MRKLYLMVIALLAFFCGCSISISTIAGEDSAADSQGQADRDRGSAKPDDGGAVVLNGDGADILTMGDIAYITHDETPSTGYLWYYDITPEGVVEIVSDEHHRYRDTDIPGGDGGLRLLGVKALVPGEAVIEMTQKRGDDILQTTIYEITVISRDDPGTPSSAEVTGDSIYSGVLTEGKFFHDGCREWIGYYCMNVGRAQYDRLNHELGGVYDLGQKVETEIQLYSAGENIILKDYIGKKITFRGEFFEGNTIYHRRNIVFEVKEISGVEPPDPPLNPAPYAYLIGAWASEWLAEGAREVIIFESGNEARLLLCYPRDYEASGEDIAGWKNGNWAVDSECYGFYEITDGNLDFVWDSDWYSPGYTVVKHSGDEIDLVSKDDGEATRYTRLPE